MWNILYREKNFSSYNVKTARKKYRLYNSLDATVPDQAKMQFAHCHNFPRHTSPFLYFFFFFLCALHVIRFILDSCRGTGMSNLSLRFNSHFPGEPGLAGVYWSKGWWRWWWQPDYWSYKSCKAPVKSSSPTNQHPVFYTPGALPVTQPTLSKHWR